MKIIKEKKIEGCLEGNNVKDFLLDGIITRELILYLGKLGRLKYYEDLEKPYFSVIVSRKYTFKGSQGNTTIRVMPLDKNSEDSLDELREYLKKYVD